MVESQTVMDHRNILFEKETVQNWVFDRTGNISELNGAQNSKNVTCVLPALLTLQQPNQKGPAPPDSIKMPVRFSIMQTSSCRKERSVLLVIMASAAGCAVCNPSLCLPWRVTAMLLCMPCLCLCLRVWVPACFPSVIWNQSRLCLRTDRFLVVFSCQECF